MRYLIYGAGAVGTLIGSRLALSGQDVRFLARPRLAAEFQQYGLHLKGDISPAHIPNPDISTSLENALANLMPDVILLTVKAFDVHTAGVDILNHLPSQVPVVCFANGINNEKTLAEILGLNRVIHGTMTTAVQLFPQGIVHVERQRGIGLSNAHSIISKLDMEMSAAHMTVRRYEYPDRMKWSKAMTNIVSNASSAILGWTPAQVFGNRGLYQLELEALRETVRIMLRMGMRPQNLPGVPLALLGYAIYLPAQLTRRLFGRIVAGGRGDKPPSLHFDIGRGRSEVEWLNGAIARNADRLGVPAPANRFLYETMMTLVNQPQEHERFRGKPNLLLSLAAEAGVPRIQGYNRTRSL